MGVRTKSLNDEDLLRQMSAVEWKIICLKSRQPPRPTHINKKLKQAHSHMHKLLKEAEKRRLLHEYFIVSR